MEETQTPHFKKLGLDFSRFQVVKDNRGSERGELLDKFLERINTGRTASGFSKISIARLGKMVAHIPTAQLYPFYKDCERARSFTAYFHWSLKATPPTTPPTPPATPSA